MHPTEAVKAKRRSDNQKPYASLDDAGKREASGRDGSGSWPTEVGVHRVVWNSGSGYNCASLLASGMACGLVRIDHLEGMFHAGRIPWGSIASIRGEKVDKTDVAGAGVKTRTEEKGDGTADKDADANADDDPEGNGMDVDEGSDGDED